MAREMQLQLSHEELGDIESAGDVAARLRALVPAGESVAPRVAEIIGEVRAGGDRALERLTRELDTGGADPPALLVDGRELDAAIKAVALDVVAGLQVAITNVALVAEAGVAHDAAVDLPQGQRVTLRDIPVRSAAVYVPAGRAPYPSTVVMGVVTARAAGVVDVAVCAPPGRSGDVDPLILGTCRLCGVERIYRMGGAQAIAALAYGTETVDAVDVIVGPGNLYVQEAKRQVSGVVGIDGFQGPSDMLVVLGADADERDAELAALDMLAQAEHGAGSIVVAAVASAGLAEALERAIDAHSTDGAERSPAVGVIVRCPDARAAVALANRFAPEHLELIGADAEALAPLVTSAGCLFVGPASATAFGDYVAGSNHVLPTAGAARFSSTLSPRDFRRRMAEVRIGGGAQKLAAAGAPLARAEGFEMHARSMLARVGDNEEP
ncbi:MAG TPA: histidinol dehydrogenase [Solirubrobacteraceae bacterium]|nr:histidinol dehydrogenase [Solirubrobacteraceae bacterium]